MQRRRGDNDGSDNENHNRKDECCDVINQGVLLARPPPGYGIPVTLAWKSQNRDWGHYAITLPLLAKSRIHQVSVECAASGVDVSVISAIAGKDVMLGVIDVGTDEVESTDLVASRIRKASPYADPARLYPCTDCGLVTRSRSVARAKMKALVEGAAIVRKEL
jgi:5-methyltetrahydropteroyltriglutamate--homocysteine methyltransferase